MGQVDIGSFPGSSSRFDLGDLKKGQALSALHEISRIGVDFQNDIAIWAFKLHLLRTWLGGGVRSRLQISLGQW